MHNTVEKQASQFLKEHRLIDVDYNSLKVALETMGFKVIEFSPILNDKDVETIIRNLNLGKTALHARGFTYANSDYRLVFVNEDLSDAEKRLVLAHEAGHVVCRHYSSGPVIGNDVKEEHEAGEFAHYILKQSTARRFKGFMSKHKTLLIAFFVLIILSVVITGFAHLKNKNSVFYGEYYVTETGNKYHQSECIHVKYNFNRLRLTVEQFESGEYAPCGTCLPQG